MMSHKLNGKWSCFYVKFESSKKHVLQPIGTMNLSFKPTGELDSGTFTAPGEKPETLDGSANSGFGEIYLELESKTYGFFEGLLTFESNSGANLAVTGKLHLAKSEAAKQLLGPRVRGARVQDDPPWIITKP